MYCGYVTTLKNVRPHSNADRLKLADCFGNTVVVGLDAAEGEIGVYFPVDGKLGIEYAEKNNLIRKKNEMGDNVGGYLDPEKRNIRAMKLRGEKSDGLFCSLNTFEDFCNLDELNVGDQVTVLNGITICEKYIPRSNSKGNGSGGGVIKKPKTNIAPLFQEHKDTEQLSYNLSAFNLGDIVELTLKMHGTSQRTGYLPKLSGYKRTFFDKLFKRVGTPIFDWGYVTGTRRVVLGDVKDTNGGYYGSNAFRLEHTQRFEGKLAKGETVYYEVVGYTNDGAPIMSSCSNKKSGLDKDFIKEYGAETVFSYGCAVGESKMYVYRMTMTNEDGFVVEYPPELVRYRCEQMGIDCVPLLTKFIITQKNIDARGSAGEYVKTVAELFYDGADPIGKSHVREGVVARITNSANFKAFKHKNFSFKVLEGIIKEVAAEPDMEEAQDEV